MYQCMRQARGAIRGNLACSPGLLRCAARAVPGRLCPRSAPADEKHEQQAPEDDQDAEDDDGYRGLRALWRPEQLAFDRSLAHTDGDRHLPVEHERQLALVLDLRRWHGGHPVDAVVVPFELTCAIDDLPPWRRVWVGDRRGPHGGVEVGVQVGGGGAAD